MEVPCIRCGGRMYTPDLGPREYVCGICKRFAIEDQAIDRMTPDELRALAYAKERAARPKEKRPTCQCFEHIRSKYKGVEGITYHDRVEVGKITIDVVSYGPQRITLYGLQNHCCQCGAPFAEVDD